MSSSVRVTTHSVVRRHGPIITPDMLPGDDGASINGPSLIKVPEWASDRLGQYYLYFAHHNGTYIRLAYADQVTGPWQVHPPGVLALEDCPSAQHHIASPDVHVDENLRRITMYFHGPMAIGKKQRTFVAVSDDGLGFATLPNFLGPPYARIFQHGRWQNGLVGRWHYGLFGAKGQRVFRSMNGLDNFQRGPRVLPDDNGIDPNARHVAIHKVGDLLRVYYTRRYDAPERILVGTIDLSRDWREWTVVGDTTLLEPETLYEGVDLPISPSKSGIAAGREHALRDPAIYCEDGRTWLLYAIAGESGIALAEIDTELT